MPTIAQKLCSDIVNPVLEQSSQPASYFSHNKKTQNIENTTRSVLIEKRKVVNNIIPKGKTKVVINKYKTRETLYNKEFVDRSLNTIISGPLTTNNYCLTNIRQRNRHCKCGQKPDTKNVHTSNVLLFCQADKACYNFTETMTCGTQVLDSTGAKQKNSPTSTKYSIDDIYRPQSARTFENPININHYNARRWALSKYPIRGPDF